MLSSLILLAESCDVTWLPLWAWPSLLLWLLLLVTSETPESSSLFSVSGVSTTGLYYCKKRSHDNHMTFNRSHDQLTEVTASMMVTSSSQYRNLSTASSTLVRRSCDIKINESQLCLYCFSLSHKHTHSTHTLSWLLFFPPPPPPHSHSRLLHCTCTTSLFPIFPTLSLFLTSSYLLPSILTLNQSQPHLHL